MTASTINGHPELAQAARLAEQGKLEQASQLVIAHLRRTPGDARALAMLGQFAMRLGALGQAHQFLRQAIGRGAETFEVRRDLASVLNQQEKLDQAELLYADLAKESGDPTLFALRAIILDKLGRHDEAMAIQQQLTTANPHRPPHWIAYGHSLRAAGRLPEAIDAYRNAIAADDEYGEAWWGLASIKRKVLTDVDIDRMRAALDIAIDVRNTAPLHFALARALHDRGLFEEAFRHYAEGNRERAETIGYEAQELTAEVDEIEQAVDERFIAALDRPSVGDATPIFIICLPRSGSTLLEQMLGSHSAIEPAGELPYIPAILRTAMEMATRRGRVTVPQLVAGLPDDIATAMGQDYLRRAALHLRTDKPFFVDKLPHNWSNVLFIKRILPQARFLDIRRTAMDCCFSNFTQSFSSAHAASFALKDIGQCYVDYVRAMAHFERIAPHLIHHISYDALIEDAESNLRGTLDYLALPWEPSVLDFHQLNRVVRTPSSEQVRRPLNRDGVGVWKPYAEWLGELRDVLGPLAA